MNISGGGELTAISYPKSLTAAPDSDLLINTNPPRRKPKPHRFSGAGLRLRNGGAPSGRSRPETPLLKWKIDNEVKGAALKEERKSSRKVRRGPAAVVSVRRLAGGLWRLRPPEYLAGCGGNGRRLKSEGQLGFQPAVGHVGGSIISCNNGKVHKSDLKELMLSQLPFSAPGHGFVHKLGPSFQLPNSAMESTTKWDPVSSKTLDEVHRFCCHMKLHDRQVNPVSVISTLESELRQAHARIQEHENERHSSKKKFEHFMRKLNEEKASWRSREHEKIRAIIDDMKTDLNRERKNRQRMELVNSKLVSELSNAKLSAKRFMQDFEKDRRARELIEEVCDELAKEIGEDKSEIEALKRGSMKLREEVENERKMLQMAEVWREERVQMKLVDAKVALDEKYAQMNKLVADMRNFLRSRNETLDEEEMREAELLLQDAATVNIQDIKEFSYEPPHRGDIFSVFEDVNFSVQNVRNDVNLVNKGGTKNNSNAFMDQNGIEEDESGWETVSQPEDQGSSFSPEGSDLSFNETRQRSHVSGEETPVSKISEVNSVQTEQLKKSSISRFWKSCPNNGENYKIISVEGMKGRLSDGRLSNGSVISPHRTSVNGGLSPSDLVGQWSSPDSTNSNTHRAKGCIEWPRSMQKGSLKAKLLEARMESQKIQLRHVLKQKI